MNTSGHDGFAKNIGRVINLWSIQLLD